MKNELQGLHPVMLERAKKFLALARQEAVVKITSTYRSPDLQKAIWMQGRYSLDEVNAVRQRIGLQAITQQDNVKVTNSRPGYSYHNYGLAFDCIFFVNNIQVKSKKHPLWKQVAEWAKEADLFWGGNFKELFDGGHFQYPHITIKDLLAGKMPK